MTEYPVQCYDNNGEPYGRYCNPYSDSGSVFLAEYLAFEHENERREDFPFPSGKIGKRYERDEVELVWEAKKEGYTEWEFVDYEIDDIRRWYDHGYSVRQALYINQQQSVDHIESFLQFAKTIKPAEKEPETVDQAAERCLSDMLSAFGDIICPEGLRKDFIGIFKDGVEWQKQQSK